MPKAEISWKRKTDDGEKLQVYAQRVGGEWVFYQRGKRYDPWQHVPEPPLDDWLELLDAVHRLPARSPPCPAVGPATPPSAGA